MAEENNGNNLCESSDSIMTILDQMADSVQLDYTDQFSKDVEPTSSGLLELEQSKNEERDDKYWERRRKNNFAAKKSRDARKVRENQLNLKVSCLENANTVLRNKLQREMKKNQELISELETCQNENDELKQRFSLKKSK